MKVSVGDVLKRRGADGPFYSVKEITGSGKNFQLVEVMRLGSMGYRFTMPLIEVRQKMEHIGTKSVEHQKAKDKAWEYTGRRLPQAHT